MLENYLYLLGSWAIDQSYIADLFEYENDIWAKVEYIDDDGIVREKSASLCSVADEFCFPSITEKRYEEWQELRGSTKYRSFISAFRVCNKMPTGKIDGFPWYVIRSYYQKLKDAFVVKVDIRFCNEYRELPDVYKTYDYEEWTRFMALRSLAFSNYKNANENLEVYEIPVMSDKNYFPHITLVAVAPRKIKRITINPQNEYMPSGNLLSDEAYQFLGVQRNNEV